MNQSGAVVYQHNNFDDAKVYIYEDYDAKNVPPLTGRFHPGNFKGPADPKATDAPSPDYNPRTENRYEGASPAYTVDDDISPRYRADDEISPAYIVGDTNSPKDDACEASGHTQTYASVKRNSSPTNHIDFEKDGRRRRKFVILVILMVVALLVAVVVALVVLLVNRQSESDCRNIKTRIMSSVGFPLKDVLVTYKDGSYDHTVTTSASGHIALNNQCKNFQISLSHERYVTVTLKPSDVPSQGSIVLDKYEFLEIIQQPVAKAAVTGDTVTLCCSATGKPEPTEYQWLKNEEEVVSVTNGGARSELTLTSVSENNAGNYSCKASNYLSMVSSETVHVDVRDNRPDFCASSLKSHMFQLPEGCLHQGRASIDKKQCTPSVCALQSSSNTCDRSRKYISCCGPLKHNPVSINCVSTISLTILVVMECGCVSCPVPEVTVIGVALGVDGTFLNNGDVIYKNEKIAQTSENGSFELSLPSDVVRVALLFRDVNASHLLDTVYTLDIVGGSSNENYITVRMTVAKNRVNISSTVANSVFLNDSSDNMGRLDIPEKAFYDENGQLYSGSVTATVGFIDPRNSSELQLAPGDLTTIDETGSEQALLPYGIFSFQFQTQTQDLLSIPIDVSVTVLNSQLNQGENNETIQLWRLNINSGRWEMEDDVIRDTKAPQSNSSTTTIHGIPYNRQWFCFAAISNPDCYSKIRVFKDAMFRPNEQLEGITVSVLTHGVANSLSRLRPITDNGATNGYCVAHSCQTSNDLSNVNYKNYIFAEKLGRPLIPADYPSDTGLSGSVSNALGYSANGNRITVQSVSLSLASNGPLYGSWYSGMTCSNAPFTDNHFRFSAEICYNGFDTVEYKEEAGEDCIEEYYLLWYTLLSYEVPNVNFTSMFIRVFVPGFQKVKVRAYSMLANQLMSNGVVVGKQNDIFGYREDCADENTGILCLEVKAPTAVSCGLNEVNRASLNEIGIKVTTLDSSVITAGEINTNILRDFGNDILNSGIETNEIAMILRGGNLYGSRYGIYLVHHEHHAISREQARRRCLSQAPEERWAFKMKSDCGRLKPPGNGWVEYAPDTLEGAVASYQCYPGSFKYGGTAHRTCQSSGEWSGNDQLICKQLCKFGPYGARGNGGPLTSDRLIYRNGNITDVAVALDGESIKCIGLTYGSIQVSCLGYDALGIHRQPLRANEYITSVKGSYNNMRIFSLRFVTNLGGEPTRGGSGGTSFDVNNDGNPLAYIEHRTDTFLRQITFFFYGNC